MKELIESGNLAIMIIISFLFLLGFIGEVDTLIRRLKKKKVFEDMERRFKTYGWNNKKEIKTDVNK